MPDYHSTVSRREFMKALGLGGIGLGLSSMSGPVFHDLDEAMTSPMAVIEKTIMGQGGG